MKLTTEQVKNWLSNEGWGTGTNFSVALVASLILSHGKELTKDCYSEEALRKAFQDGAAYQVRPIEGFDINNYKNQ